MPLRVNQPGWKPPHQEKKKGTGKLGASIRIALLVSLLIHVVPVGPQVWAKIQQWLGGEVPKAESEPGPEGGVRSEAELQAAREALVKQALEQRKAGALKLGEFILSADALDAEAEGDPFDQAEVRERLQQRCARLESKLKSADVVHAVQDSFRDLPYSAAVNRMSRMLLQGVGACGATTHLIAACLYDLGRREHLALRYWGGVNARGATHITPTWKQGDKVYDLAEGQPVYEGGAVFPAHEVIEAYARAHGILPQLEGERGGEPAIDAAAAHDFSYPPNTDVFAVGEAPLFSERAKSVSEERRPVADYLGVAAGGGAVVPSGGFSPISDDWLETAASEMGQSYQLPALSVGNRRARDPMCPVTVDLLFEKGVVVTTPSGSSRVDLVPTPSEAGLAYLSGVIARYEHFARRSAEADRIIADACLTVAYDWAAPRYAAAGYSVISHEATDRARRHAKRARENLEQLRRGSDGDLILQLSRKDSHWTLIAIGGGIDALLEMEERVTTDTLSPLRSAEPDEGEVMPDPSRTQALLSERSQVKRLVDAKLSVWQRMSLSYSAYRLSLDDELDVEVPEGSWLAKGSADHARVMKVGAEHGFFGDAYITAYLDLAKNQGATEKDLTKLRADLESVAKMQRAFLRQVEKKEPREPQTR